MKARDQLPGFRVAMYASQDVPSRDRNVVLNKADVDSALAVPLLVVELNIVTPMILEGIELDQTHSLELRLDDAHPYSSNRPVHGG
jgi:hypothetical protein